MNENELDNLVARLREQAVTPVPFPKYALIDAANAIEGLRLDLAIAAAEMARQQEAASAALAAVHPTEPSGPAVIRKMPPSPETARRHWEMYCPLCGIEECTADAPDEPRVVARRDEHNRGHDLVRVEPTTDDEGNRS